MTPASIAHYKITGKLGEGGMGAVYRATDTKLGRDVAVKVLPESFANDPDRLARFTREAQVLAALNHPNIAAIYGVEQGALVMELVEGDDLRGPLEEDRALPLVQQLIDALEYAHEKGIIHRDLKPANIKVTPEGRLKVLDFGLAKAVGNEPSQAEASATMTLRGTVAGVIMGTAAYMAPEQARGHSVDKRADIWAFGAVVYEMVTGRVLFDGTTVSDTLAAVLRQEVAFDAAPARYRRLLRACLERDARKRMRDIGDARLLLDETTVAPAKSSKAPWIVAIAAIVVAAILGIALWRATHTERPLIRFSAELGPDAVSGPEMTAVLSPDGRRVLYRMVGPNGIVFATRLLDQAKATVLAGTEGNSFGFFSPDSQWIAFFAGKNLKKISVQGGEPTTLCDAPDPHGGAWMNDQTIVAVNGFDLIRVPESGGSPQIVPTPKSGWITKWPQALPGDRQVLATVSPLGTLNFQNAELDVISLKTGERKTVLRGGYFGRYLPTGHLLYIHDDTLYGVRFDPSRLQVEGTPAPLLEQVSSSPFDGAGHFDFSLTGAFVYVSGSAKRFEQPIAWLEPSGNQQLFNEVSGTCLRVSPTGRRLAFASKGDISVYDLDRDGTTRITFDTNGNNRHPVWTPDGNHLVYAGSGGIWWTRSDGSAQPTRILEGNPAPTPWSLATDGPKRLRLAYHTQASQTDTQRDIWVLPIDITDADRPAPAKPEVFLATPAIEISPSFSPDGRWMAYTSTESGGNELFVRRYLPGAPAAGGKWQLTTGAGALFPVWSRDGKQLLFRSANSFIMAIDYTTSGESFTAGKPHEWSKAPIYMTGVFQDFDLFPDGKRAAIVALPDETKGGIIRPHVNFLLNFSDELKRRLP